MWRSKAGPLDVAVKTLKSGSEERDKVKFLQEAAIMAQFKHPNVVSLYGVVSNGGIVRFFCRIVYNNIIVYTNNICIAIGLTILFIV